jgi:hypothetical protein
VGNPDRRKLGSLRPPPSQGVDFGNLIWSMVSLFSLPVGYLMGYLLTFFVEKVLDSVVGLNNHP